MLGLIPASVVFCAVAGQHPLKRRRAPIVGAFVHGMIAVSVLVAAMYQPTFIISGKLD
jgi:hypothetical protein